MNGIPDHDPTPVIKSSGYSFDTDSVAIELNLNECSIKIHNNANSVLFAHNINLLTGVQTLSKARQGILPTLFQSLFKITVHTFYENVSTTKNWNGYRIFAVDGTKIEVGNSKSNLEYLGCMFDPKNPKRIYSGALESIFYDALDDVIVDSSIHKFLFSEREAAKNHLKVMDTLNITQKSVIIFDRGYYSEEMFQYCLNQGLYCLFRIKEGLNIAKQCDGDIITYTNGNTKKGLKPMKIRVISVLLDSGTTEYLATNIMDEKITPMMFKEL